MLLCRHAGWGLRRIGVAAKEGAQHKRSVSGPAIQGEQPRLWPIRTRLWLEVLVSGTGIRRRARRELTKLFGGPVMIGKGGRLDHHELAGWSAGPWSV